MIRRLKKDVMDQLPAKRRQQVSAKYLFLSLLQVILTVEERHNKILEKITKEYKKCGQEMWKGEIC